MQKLWICTLVLILVFTQRLHCQSFCSGLLVDYSTLFEKKNTHKTFFALGASGVESNRTNSEEKLTHQGVGLYYSLKTDIGYELKLELRPGILLTEEPFFAPQIGVHLRYYAAKGFYLSSGVTLELYGSRETDYEPPKLPLLGSLSLGKELIRNLWLTFSAIKTFDEYYGNESTKYSNPQIVINHYLVGAVKFGLEYNL